MNHPLKWIDGKLVLELEAVIRIPILIEAITPQTWVSKIDLTRRERTVLDGVLRGLGYKEIAYNINISERTVKFHASNLFVKFQVRDRGELAAIFTGHESKKSSMLSETTDGTKGEGL